MNLKIKKISLLAIAAPQTKTLPIHQGFCLMIFKMILKISVLTVLCF